MPSLTLRPYDMNYKCSPIRKQMKQHVRVKTKIKNCSADDFLIDYKCRYLFTKQGVQALALFEIETLQYDLVLLMSLMTLSSIEITQ